MKEDVYIETKKFIERIEIELNNNPNIDSIVKSMVADTLRLAKNYLEKEVVE